MREPTHPRNQHERTGILVRDTARPQPLPQNQPAKHHRQQRPLHRPTHPRAGPLFTTEAIDADEPEEDDDWEPFPEPDYEIDETTGEILD